MLKKLPHFNIQHCNVSAMLFQLPVLYGYGKPNKGTEYLLRRKEHVTREEELVTSAFVGKLRYNNKNQASAGSSIRRGFTVPSVPSLMAQSAIECLCIQKENIFSNTFPKTQHSIVDLTINTKT